MNEELVSFDLAKKLKEKGLNFRTRHGYLPPIKLVLESFNYKDWSESDGYPAPTISQVLKWLREEKKMYIEPCILADADTDADGRVINEYTYWSFSVTNIETGDMIYYEYEHIDGKRFDSYEEAAIAGIEYVIDNLI